MRVEREGGRSADNVRLRAEIVTFDRVIEQPRHPRRDYTRAILPELSFWIEFVRNWMNIDRKKYFLSSNYFDFEEYNSGRRIFHFLLKSIWRFVISKRITRLSLSLRDSRISRTFNFKGRKLYIFIMEYERSIGLTYKRFEATLPRGIVTRRRESWGEARRFSIVVLIVPATRFSPSSQFPKRIKHFIERNEIPRERFFFPRRRGRESWF